MINTTASTIEISTVQAIVGLVVILVGIGIAWGSLKTVVSSIKKTLEEIKPDLKDVRERFMVVEDRVDSLWKDKLAPAHSPRQLNERGTTILNSSGIKEIVDQKKEKLLQLVKDKQAANAYDAEIAVFSVVTDLPKYCPDIIDQLKTGAFKVGADIDAVLFVGGIYLRDLIFSELGFKINDVDKVKQ